VCDKGNIMKKTKQVRPAPAKGIWDWIMGGGWKGA
jgi:hypothetical protein